MYQAQKAVSGIFRKRSFTLIAFIAIVNGVIGSSSFGATGMFEVIQNERSEGIRRV